MKKLNELSPSSLRLRRRIWQRVKRDLEQRIFNDPAGHEKIGLCQSVKNAVRATSGAPENMLPEFEAKKPKQTWKENKAWWWNPYRPSSRQKRIKVADEILAEIDSLLKEKK